ncbi:hypothetical protein [Chondromyces apiculatus]|uniref:Lipoprotein n=1 Tax=Chondromyces apiculatus DSM 436 TaxID=1192034 RepID=A0A017SWI7_9BACT|nr:hypothetical protein [Chondromyces apiculatus]EYF00671.1 Hypothetical protein CAP_0362 [Chondromyces apiculatus DSM 436]
MKLPGLKLSTFALLAASMVTGCGGGIAGYCEDAMECSRGNESDVEVCIIELERQEDIAAIYGCEDDFDKAFTCLQDESSCSNRIWSHDNECNGDLTDYVQCVN